jgi:hypothetical protein
VGSSPTALIDLANLSFTIVPKLYLYHVGPAPRIQRTRLRPMPLTPPPPRIAAHVGGYATGGSDRRGPGTARHQDLGQGGG